jgi:hypothetical protein
MERLQLDLHLSAEQCAAALLDQPDAWCGDGDGNAHDAV